jgi:cytosine/adenosine deaminase-related metal-dependent hydrolase
VADLVIHSARLVATVDDQRRELPGGWVSITAGLVEAVGASTDRVPDATTVIDASDCLVTPGLVNTHHHMFQNLTRAYPPMTDKPLFGWLQSLYPLWSAIDEEAVYASAFLGLVELALGGCTTSTDHLYLHPKGAGDLLGAEISAARDVGLRFHPTRGSMSLSEKDGGLPPDRVVQDDDTILPRARRRSHATTTPRTGRCCGSPSRRAARSASPRSSWCARAELAERLDVRLHTHFAENVEDDEFSVATFGLPSDGVPRADRLGHVEGRGWRTA